MNPNLMNSGAGVSRRSFLESLGGMGGSALLMAGMSALGFGIASANAAPPELGEGGKGKKVIVLGAGVAGMTSAYELSKAGYDVTIIEAREFAGGRCQTARKGFKLTELGGETQECDFDDGLYINHGPWRIPYHHHSTLHYTKLFNVPLAPHCHQLPVVPGLNDVHTAQHRQMCIEFITQRLVFMGVAENYGQGW